MTEWQGLHLSDPTQYAGFVYIIHNKLNNRHYIGQKKLAFKRSRKPLKGRTNKRHYVVESDWKTYWGSCQELLDDIGKYGEENFTRHILYLCHKKAEMNYYEAREQFERDVLRDPMSYNRIINCRISSKQLGL